MMLCARGVGGRRRRESGCLVRDKVCLSVERAKTLMTGEDRNRKASIVVSKISFLGDGWTAGIGLETWGESEIE